MTERHADPVDLGYEVRDVDPRRLVLLGVTLALVLALTALETYFLLAYMSSHQPAQAVTSAIRPAPELPPQPRLQVEPSLDLAEKRRAENAVLQTYGWVDRAAGTVRIPIDRAMDLMAERARRTAGPASSATPPAESRR